MKLLLISRQSPYGGSYAREALDIALSAAAFEVEVGLLFMDDGVFQLLKEQDTRASGNKNLEAVLSALSLYDIQRLWVDEASLKTRKLPVDALSLPVSVCDNATIRRLIAEHDRVLAI